MFILAFTAMELAMGLLVLIVLALYALVLVPKLFEAKKPPTPTNWRLLAEGVLVSVRHENLAPIQTDPLGHTYVFEDWVTHLGFNDHVAVTLSGQITVDAELGTRVRVYTNGNNKFRIVSV